jgi:hypothetical protein
MHTPDASPNLPRRAFLGGALATAGALALSACATTSMPISLTEAVRRLLVLSSERAFMRMTQPGGYWDQQVLQIGLGEMLGTRGDTLSRVLTSTLFKQRLEAVVADAAVDASYRAAPIVTEAVRVIGVSNALALVRGGPTAATTFLRGEMGGRLVDALVPEVGEAMRVAEDPLMRELIAGLTGVDVGSLSRSLAGRIEDVIWREIGNEEAAIRANPAQTRDPVLIGVFAADAAL